MLRKRKRLKRIVALVVAMVLMFSLVDYKTLLFASANESGGGTKSLVTKTATTVNKEERIYQLDFTADLEELFKDKKEIKPIDVILLVDMSTSMTDPIVGTGKDRLGVMKDVATKFVDDLADYCPESTLSIATFYSSSKIITNPLTVSEENVSILKDKISNIDFERGEDDKITQLQGTSHDYGLLEAKKILEEQLNGSTKQKYIILLTDGTPNPSYRNIERDKELYPEVVTGDPITFYNFEDNKEHYYGITAIQHADVLRDLCVVRILNQIKELDKKIKVATVGFETLYDLDKYDNDEDREKAKRDMDRIQALFDVVTGVDFLTGEPVEEGGSRDYQFYTDTNTSLSSVFSELMDNFERENSIATKKPTVVDYIAKNFIPLDDEGNKISIEAAREGVTLENNAVVKYDDEKELYYVVWGSGANEQLDITSTWSSSILVKADDNLVGGVTLPTNEDNSGVYADNELLKEFPIPEVEVAERYKVTYSFVSGTEGKDLPEEVTKLLPVDISLYKDGTKLNPSELTEIQVEDGDGRWIFRQWDADEKTIDGANQEFIGTWEYVPNPSYDVTHVFESITADKELPDAVKDLLPSDQLGYKHGTVVKPSELTETEVKDGDGKWVFREWDAEEKTINGANQEFVGYWEYISNSSDDIPDEVVTKDATVEGNEEERTYKLSFTANLKAILDKYSAKNSEPIDVILLIDMSTSMWKEVEGTGKIRLEVMKDVATNFVDELAGFSDKSTLSIATYYYTSKIITEPVMVDTEENKNQLKDKIADIYFEDEQIGGTNHDYGLIRAREILEGSLKDSENQKYIILLTDGMPNPDGRDETIDKEEYPEAFDYTPIAYWKPDTGEYKTISDNEGIKSSNVLRDFCVRRILGQIKELEEDIKVATVGFEIADDEGIHVQALFNEVTGSNQEDVEKYQFWTNSNTSLADIFDKLVENFEEESFSYKKAIIKDYIAAGFVPLDDNGEQITVERAKATVTLANGAVIKYDDEKELYYVVWGEGADLKIDTNWSSSILIQAKDDFVGGNDIPTNEANSGVYVDGELKEEFPIPTVDVYVRNYDVTYEFVSGTEGKALPEGIKDFLPEKQTGFEDESTVYPSDPSGYEFVDGDGRWVFRQWDAEEKTIDGANQNFVGTWEYVPNPSYDVTHEFVSGTEGKELPDAVKELLPSDQLGYKDGTVVNPSELEKVEVEDGDGRWVFRQWDAEEKTIDGANQNFVGTWEYVPNPSYDVTHEFVSGTEGKELPDAVKDLLPSDQLGLKDGTVVNPSELEKVVVEDEDGRWIFRQWDAEEKTIAGEDQKFTGTWEYVPNPSYDVTHEFVSGTVGKTLPEEVMELLPTDKLGLKDGTEVEVPELSETVVEVEDGTWTFVGWDPTDDIVINGADVNFKGTWVFTEKTTYDVTHEFVSGTEGMELPDEIKALLPADKTGFDDGSKVNPSEVTTVEVKDDNGRWIFGGWDESEKIIAGEDQNFVGTWEYVPDPSYDATHKFVSGTEGMELPEEVTDLLPSDKLGNKDGATVTPTTPSETVVKTEDGTWTFEGYKENEIIINGSNVVFEGEWTYKEDPKYEVVHKFISGTFGKDLPDEVKALIPSNQTDKKDGSKVTPTAPSKTEVVVDDGKWVFKYWDADEKTIEGKDQNFIGTWVFVENPKYDVTYEFESGTDGVELPKEVTDLLPDAQTGNKNGATVTAKEPSKTVVETEDGKWTFEGYDKSDVTLNGKDEVFKGTWTYEEYPKYDVTYEFISGTEGKDLPDEINNFLPTDQTGFKDGSKVNPLDPSGLEFEEGDGRWVFRTWDAEEKTINGANQNFVGTWEYVPNPSYDVTHKFVSGTEGAVLPEEVTDLLPLDKLGNKDGAVVTPTVPEQTVVETEDGKWTFEGYDKTDVTINGKDEVFEGTWTYEETPRYDVTHEFVSGTEGVELPQSVKDLLPDPQEDVKSGEKVTPTVPEQTVVETEDGKWTFEGWDEDEITITDSDEVFKGTWTYEENPKYEVVHKFISGTFGKDLPDEVKALIPSNQTDKKNGEVVTPTAPSQTEVAVEDGKWVFKNWDENQKTIADADQNFIGTWEFVENPKYDVTHEFISGTPGKELPDEVKNLLPADQTGFKDGSKVNPSDPLGVEVKDEDGRWIFRGWDADEKTINGSDQKFAGTWEYVPDPSYDVTHEFVSGTEGETLPEEVTDLLPSDKLGNKDGAVVKPTVPEQTVVETEDGKWTFEGYDKTDVTINGKDEVFKGTWTYEENPKYDVTHEFISGTSGVELPQSVKDLLPEVKEDVKPGDKVTPTTPSKTVVETEDGKWTFEGWDEEEKTITDSDEVFKGTWTYEENPKYEVVHKFISGTFGKELPEAVKNLLPSNQTDKKNGEVVTPTAPAQTVVVVEDGKWVFKNWDENQKTIADADQNFIGTWEFVENPKYDVTYEFESGTDGKELPKEVTDLLPSDKTGLEDGAVVKPTVPSQTVVETEDGKWTFEGWDDTEITINGSDEVFKGTWTYEETPKYDVTHEFISGTPGVELPQSIKDLLPAVKDDVKPGDKVTPTTPSKTEVETEDGKWTFEGWDEDEIIISDSDESFKGTWTYVEYPKYNVTHEFISGTAGKELPQEVMNLLPGNQTDKKDGSKVNPTAPSSKKVKLGESKWVFKSWDADEKVINGADQKFVGTWEFVEKYETTYEFISGTPGMELPDEVLDFLIPFQNSIKEGGDVTIEDLIGKVIYVENGKWVFQEWDEEEKEENGVDESFLGTWIFIEIPFGSPEFPLLPGVPDMPESPDLGDNTNANVWNLISIVSLLVVMCLAFKKKDVFDN